MKYMLLIYSNPESWAALSEAERDTLAREHAALYRELAAAGTLVGAEALADPATTTTVRVRDGVPAVSDGPFAEAKEHLAGYYLIEVVDLDAAHAVAARVPDARLVGVEVRPVMAPSGMEM